MPNSGHFSVRCWPVDMRGAGDQLSIGERIAFYRRRRGLSQVVLADLVSRSEGWLSKIERGERDIRRLDVLADPARGPSMLASGVSIKEVAEYPGHHDPGNHDPGYTLRIYTHLVPSSHERARAATNRVFKPRRPPQTAQDSETA